MNPTASSPAFPPPDRPSPVFCIAAIALTGLGLLAAGLGIKWGAAPPPGDALRSSWFYVNIMLLATWLVFWPAWPPRSNPPAGRAAQMLGQWSCLALGAIPALCVSAFLSGVTFRVAAAPLLMQLAFSLFAAGLLTFAHRTRRPSTAAAAACILSALALAGPVLLFIASNFFPKINGNWAAALPAICLSQTLSPAASGSAMPHAPALAAATYALIGLILLLAARRK